MITKHKINQALEFVKNKCKADDYTISIHNVDNLLTRFAQNSITQHIKGNNLDVSLKVAFDNKVGSASVNNLNEDSLQYLIKTAENMAKLNQPDPEFVVSEPNHSLPQTDNFKQNTADLTVNKVVDNIQLCVKNAEKYKAKLAGISEKKIVKSYLATKNGFQGEDELTTFSHSMTMKKNNIETKVFHSVKDYAEFDMNKLIEKLNRQFNSLKEPKAMEKGKYNVILRPAAVLRWMFYLIWTFDRREADEGMTPYTDKLDKQFFGKNFSFYSSMNDKDLVAPSYFKKGVPVRNIEWITNGVIKNMRRSRYYAKKIKKEPSTAYNIVVKGSETTEKEMMQQVDRGIIINNFWYIRPVDRKAGEWTGLTRDGVLYFEEGKLTNSVTNFRWNEIFHEATKRILALGKSVQKEYYAKVPTMLIKDFNFVDTTTF